MKSQHCRMQMTMTCDGENVVLGETGVVMVEQSLLPIDSIISLLYAGCISPRGISERNIRLRRFAASTMCKHSGARTMYCCPVSAASVPPPGTVWRATNHLQSADINVLGVWDQCQFSSPRRPCPRPSWPMLKSRTTLENMSMRLC